MFCSSLTRWSHCTSHYPSHCPSHYPSHFSLLTQLLMFCKALQQTLKAVGGTHRFPLYCTFSLLARSVPSCAPQSAPTHIPPNPDTESWMLLSKWFLSLQQPMAVEYNQAEGKLEPASLTDRARQQAAQGYAFVVVDEAHHSCARKARCRIIEALSQVLNICCCCCLI